MFNPRLHIPAVRFSPDLGQQLVSGPTHPLLLFPVRLETRFFPQPNGTLELRVRVYPDQIHFDTHEPALTAAEITWGQHFWEQTWRAGDDEVRRQEAWRQLADRFEATRAAWIARLLTPLNPDDHPVLPIPADQPLLTPPRFPTPATKTEAWTRAPHTRVLPAQWIALGYADGQLVAMHTGKPIPDQLPVGPSPNFVPPDNDEELAIEKELRWMVDFAAAEEVGMGLRFNLGAQTKLDILLVFGVKGALSPTASTERLIELCQAHHYTAGLSFVPYGLPTNNTADAPAGFSSRDPGHEISYAVERQQTALRAGDQSNGAVLSAALGLADADAASTLANLRYAAATEQLDAQQMNTALWSATLGYFLSQMITARAGQFADEDRLWTRQHFINYVRANGPLPSLRIGKQPYGVLPVTSLDAWRALPGSAAQETKLVELLRKLREIWRANIGQVPRVGRSNEPGATPDPEGDLAELLSTDGLSTGFAARSVLGRHYVQHLWPFIEPTPELPDIDLNTPAGRRIWARVKQLWLQEQRRWWAKQEELAGQTWRTLGFGWTPRLLGAAFYGGAAAPLGAPLVQSEVGETKLLTTDYISPLLNADWDAIKQATDPALQPQTLLHALLRHSLSLEYAEAAWRLLRANNPFIFGSWTDEEFVDIHVAPIWASGLTVSRGLELVAGALSNNQPLKTYLRNLTSFDDEKVQRLGALRASLQHLRGLSSARLERLMVGTLDLCSYRLDAWITSLASARLRELRREQANGIYLGGYGWVINLQPAAARTVVNPPTGEGAPLFAATDDPGFTHAPSLAHAATAAILHSGHLTNADAQTRDLLAIDLSSERVRLAGWLLDGVRQGQPLGALLGYRFERRLQEAKPTLARFIKHFRNQAPLVAQKLEQTSQPSEVIAANNVVDGLRLQRLWQQPDGAAKVLPAPLTPTEKQALEAELNALADAADAVSDAVLAESVYQTVRGNPTRAGSTLDAIALGEAPPPELEVARTPRTGIALTHRLMTIFSGEPTLSPDWDNASDSPRAAAEPHLNAWAARLLVPPQLVRCVVERLDTQTGAVVAAKELRLSELNLAPLDFIYAAADNRHAQQAEIEQRLFYITRRQSPDWPAHAPLRLQAGRAPNLPANELSYGEFTELTRTVRKLMAGARALTADDLSLPDQAQTAVINLDELTTRADNAERDLRQATSSLRGLLRAAEPKAAPLRDALLRLARFGLPGAVPLSALGDDAAEREMVLTQAVSIEPEVAQRLAQLDDLQTAFNPAAAPQARRDHQLARLRHVFGRDFIALPRFAPANGPELEQTFAASAQTQGNDPLAAITWFTRAARVRDGVARLDAALTYAEAVGAHESLNLIVGQLPFAAPDRWVGLPWLPDQPPAARLSLIVQTSGQLEPRQPLSGLLLDEWVEVVPNRRETTGLAFQYNQPDAVAPQAILLAVPPAPDQPWTLWLLQQVLLETLDLARLRGVDAQALDEVGHYLPALYFALNVKGDTVSTDFTKLYQ